MISGKLVWFLTVQLTVFTGCHCLNANETAIEQESAPQTTIPPVEANSTTETATFEKTPISNNSTSDNKTQLEITEILHGDSPFYTTRKTTEEISFNTTGITNFLNISSANITFVDQSWNETFKTNYTTLVEAVDASEGSTPFRLQNTAAIAAGVFLISAVIGYFSCVGYRRFLQRKYGNSQILIGEEVYDTTDLRYFEI